MACYHPLKVAWYGEVTTNHKKKYEFVNPDYDDYKSAVEVKDIPCGKCMGCRIEYSRQWATRCMLEAKKYKYNAFINLTYDEEHVHHTTGHTIEGEEIDRLTLYPPDVTKFMKDLRRYFDYNYKEQGIKFYLCGEYGDTTGRPHYHIVAFNIHIRDLIPFYKNAEGDQIYISETIAKIWKKGQITVGEVTWQSCAYTARYVMKKRKGKDAEEIYKILGIEPEFVRMSRNPGIGRAYYEENKDNIYLTDEIFLDNGKGKVIKFKPGKYFDRLYDLESPEAMEAIKLQRKKNAILCEKNRQTKTNLTKKEYLRIQESNLLQKTTKLKRTI